MVENITEIATDINLAEIYVDYSELTTLITLNGWQISNSGSFNVSQQLVH